MMGQYIIIAFVLGWAVAYACIRIYRAIRHANDKCYGCSGCALHDAMIKKQGRYRTKPNCYQKSDK